MKKRISFLVLTLSMLVFVGAFSVCFVSSVAAYYQPQTSVYYMNGYKMYGYCTLNTGVAGSSTYCENLSYAKRVDMQATALHSNGLEHKDYYADTGYVTNGFDTISAEKYGSATWTMIGVAGDHYVKASEHMYWSSKDSNDSTLIVNR